MHFTVNEILYCGCKMQVSQRGRTNFRNQDVHHYDVSSLNSNFAEELLENFSQQRDAWHHCLFFMANTRNEYVLMYCMTVLEVRLLVYEMQCTLRCICFRIGMFCFKLMSALPHCMPCMPCTTQWRSFSKTSLTLADFIVIYCQIWKSWCCSIVCSLLRAVF